MISHDTIVNELVRANKQDLIPEMISRLARDPTQLEIQSIREANDELNFMVVEHNFNGLTNESDWKQWLLNIEETKKRKPQSRFVQLPPAPNGIDRLHAEFRQLIENGKLKLTDKIWFTVTLVITSDSVPMLMVKNYDGEKGKGIARDFYVNVLPTLTKKLGLRFIVGQNTTENLSFFTQTLGRFTYRELKPQMQTLLFPKLDPLSVEGDLTTIQFIYSQDVKDYV